MATKRKKKGPTKRPRTGPRKRTPKLWRALDSKGQQLKKGQRVKFDGVIYAVTKVFVVAHPDGAGKQEIAYFRNRETRTLSQIHLPLVTIVSDGPRKRKKSGSLKDRLRRRQ